MRTPRGLTQMSNDQHWDKALRATDKYEHLGSKGGYHIYRSKRVIMNYDSKRFGKVTMGIDMMEDEPQKDTFFWVKGLRLLDVDPDSLRKLKATGLFSNLKAHHDLEDSE